MPEELFVFCDASIAIKNKVAIGSFLILEKSAWDRLSVEGFLYQKSTLQDKIKHTRFDTHKSTLAEIKTFLYVMKTLAPLENKKICLFTDCQTLCDLYGDRQKKLLERNFKKKDGSPLNHGTIYKEVIDFFLSYEITVTKVKGHKPKSEKDNKVDKLFSLVDTASRKELRMLVK